MRFHYSLNTFRYYIDFREDREVGDKMPTVALTQEPNALKPAAMSEALSH